MSGRVLSVLCLCLLALASHAEEDAYYGFNLDLLAEAVARQTTLRTQHGEEAGNAKFDEWLASKDTTRANYTNAWNTWWERFRADATGKLEAQFHTLNSVYVTRYNYSDVPDRSGEKQAGVTLDAYAKIAAEITKTPDDLLGVLKRNGIQDEAQWQRVNEAWAAAMKADTSYALTQQYAALFMKHAGPEFQQQHQQRMADSIAAGRARSAPPTSTPKPPTIEETIAEMETSTDKRERWSAARAYALQCDLWLGPARKNPEDPRAKYCGQAELEARLLPVILESIDRFDDETVSYGTFMLDFLDELNLKTPSAKMAVQRALTRSEERLAVFEAAFEPIQDKAVPERITLRRRIDDYTQAVSEFRATLETW